MTWREELGEQIKKAREVAGFSQEQLAKRMSVGRAQLSNYENGKSDAPVHVVAEIAEALETDFTIRGCRIGRDSIKRPALAAEPFQMCFEFDVDHRFPQSAVTIRPTKDSILITAVIPRLHRG